MATGTQVIVHDPVTQGGRTRRVTHTWTANGSGVFVSDAIFARAGLFLGVETRPGTVTAYNLQVRRGGITTAFLDLLNGKATTGTTYGALRSATLPEFAAPIDGNGNSVVAGLQDESLYVCIDTAGAGGTGEYSLVFLQ